MKNITFISTIFCLLLIGTIGVPAQDTGKVTIHGFGGWGYGITDGPHYLYGDDGGHYDHAQFYLNINANVTENLAVISQFGFEQNAHGTFYDFDYAFAEYTVSDLLRLRVGKVKHAFGIYGEILKVGTIRPFMSLAQGVYGSHGFVGKGLNGIAITGSFHPKNGWGLTYDLYFGELKTEAEMPVILGFAFNQDPNTLNDSMTFYEKDISDLIGGRLSVSPPIEGLSIGFSGYSGEDKGVEGTGGGYTGDQKSYGIFFEYMSASLWIRSEVIRHIQNAKASAEGSNLETINNSFYVELAYKFLNHFQAAFRYEHSEADITEIDETILPRFFQEYLNHTDIVFGLNYWFNPNLVIKASYHMVDGITFAWPHFRDPMAFLQGQFDEESTLFQIGAQFSF